MSFILKCSIPNIRDLSTLKACNFKLYYILGELGWTNIKKKHIKCKLMDENLYFDN